MRELSDERKADPVRALIIATSLAEGGAQRFTSTLLKHLDPSRVEAQLCLLRNRREFPLPRWVETRTLGYRGLPSLVPVARRLARIIDDAKPEVILSTIMANNLLTGLSLSFCRHRPPWIARIGNTKEHEGSIRLLAARMLLRRSQIIVCNSKGLKQEFAREFPSLSKRIRYLYNPVDIDRLRARAIERPVRKREEGSFLLVSMGRLVDAKRLDLLLGAVQRVREEVPIELWILGEGRRRACLERMANRLDLADSIHWMGQRENPHALLSQADLFVLSSDHEGLPNALIEAQALGVPAVSTDCSYGPSEIIAAGKTGLLTKVGDVADLARTILELLLDAAARDRMRSEAITRTEARFSLTAAGTQWQQTLCELGLRGRKH